MRQKFILFLLLFTLCCTIQTAAKVKVRGTVVDASGKSIEYVSVVAVDDSIGVVANVDGQFELDVSSEAVRLAFSHVSYESVTVKAIELSLNNKVVMNEKNVSLTDVNIVTSKNMKTITGKGMRNPGNVAISGINHSIREVGSVTSVGNNYTVDKIAIPIVGCSYDKCKLSLHFYEIDGKRFIPIQRTPIYIAIDRCGKRLLAVEPTEKIILRKGRRYFVSVSLVELTGNGSVTFPAYFKSGYVRNLESGRQKKLPISLGLELTGREVKE